MTNITNPRDKVKRILNNGQTAGVTLNPFLKKDGSLRNPYINYQEVLDNPKITNKVKTFISEATGFAPTRLAEAAEGATARAVSANTSGTTGTAAITPVSDSSIVSAARKYIGTPYVWGGESMSEGGMDCSGFVYNTLKDAGYKVGRTTAQGYRNYGTSVSKSNMQPGDLVFYGKDGNASHIGIYIGNGQMIHSSGGSKNTKSNPGKGVSIANVDYRNDFIEARRY